jgi:hypothetical protein
MNAILAALCGVDIDRPDPVRAAELDRERHDFAALQRERGAHGGPNCPCGTCRPVYVHATGGPHGRH